MADIYLIRHGHVDYTPPNKITAHNPLTELGQRMARRVAERCVALDPQLVYASTMLRAQQTADAILERLPDVPRIDTPIFQEVSIRDLADFPGEQPPEDLGGWNEEQFAYANRQMWRRIIKGLDEVWETARERELERVALVAHAGPINAILRSFLGEDVVPLRTAWFHLDYTGVSCIRENADGRWVLWTNDARHIEDLRDEYEG